MLILGGIVAYSIFAIIWLAALAEETDKLLEDTSRHNMGPTRALFVKCCISLLAVLWPIFVIARVVKCLLPARDSESD